MPKPRLRFVEEPRNSKNGMISDPISYGFECLVFGRSKWKKYYGTLPSSSFRFEHTRSKSAYQFTSDRMQKRTRNPTAHHQSPNFYRYHSPTKTNPSPPPPPLLSLPSTQNPYPHLHLNITPLGTKISQNIQPSPNFPFPKIFESREPWPSRYAKPARKIKDRESKDHDCERWGVGYFKRFGSRRRTKWRRSEGNCSRCRDCAREKHT